MSLRELLPTLRNWEAEGAHIIGRAVLVRAFASSPRAPGAVLLATEDGRLDGSVSGGCVEVAVADEVRRARRTARSRVVRYGISDEIAWDLGLACGGVIDVLIEPTIRLQAITAAEADEAVLLTPLPADAPDDTLQPVSTGPGEPPGDVLVVHGRNEAPESMRSAVAGALDDGVSRVVRDTDDRQWFVEAFPAMPRLVIIGAVHMALPLLRFARELGYHTVIVDRRATFASEERTQDADEMHVAWPEDAFGVIGLGPRDSVAILSHDPKLDEPAIVAALRAGCRYVGGIGSKKTQADRRERLLRAGLADADLSRLHGPIGLDLGGRAPAEVALTVMAEIIAARHGASGRPMIEK